jgi:hypothetical protein
VNLVTLIGPWPNIRLDDLGEPLVKEFTHGDSARVGQTAHFDRVQGSRKLAPSIFFGLAVKEFPAPVWK